MFKEGNPTTDKFCLDILKESGDINTLPVLAAVLERYHNAPAKKDMPQVEKSEMLMLTLETGTAIISRNMSKVPPALTVPVIVTEDGITRLDYTSGSEQTGGLTGMGLGMDSDMGMGPGMGTAGMGTGMAPAMPPGGGMTMPSASGTSGSSSTDGTSGTTTVVALDKLQMQPDEIKNNAPFEWLDRVYKVAAKHISDSAKLMESVQTENSGRKIGRDIRNERVDKEFFRKVINTSEEGLSAYLTSRSDVKKLTDQKDRVISSLGTYQRQLNRMSASAKNAFDKASTGVDPNATTSTTGGTESGTTRPATANPLGRRL